MEHVDELVSDDTSNLTKSSALPPRFNLAFSCIKQDSLYNLVTRMDALEDSSDDTSTEPSIDISEEPSHRRPPKSQLSSSIMWESGIDFDCDDGLEELRRELGRADPLQTESVEDNSDKVLLVASQQENPLRRGRISEHIDAIFGDMKRFLKSHQKLNPQELQVVPEASEIEPQGDDTSSLATSSPSPPRFNPAFSFIKQDSLYNLVTRMDALEDSSDDTCTEPSIDISEESSHRRPPNSQLSSSRIWKSKSDYEYDNGLEMLQGEFERADPLQTELSLSGMERDGTDIHDSIAVEFSLQIKELCTVRQNQQRLQMLQERNNALISTLSEITVEKNKLKK